MLQLAASPSFRRPAPEIVPLGGLGLTLETYDGLDGLAPLWDAMSRDAAPSVFQSYDWLAAWSRTAAPAQGERPLIALVRSMDGRPRLLLPLGLRRTLGATVAGFLGQAHGNYGAALMDPAFQCGLKAGDVPVILRTLAQARGIAAYHLDKQPATWNGLANPLATWSAHASPNDSYLLPLDADPDGLRARLFSKRARKRRKALSAAGETWMGTVKDEGERRRLLHAFLACKGEQLAAQGAADVFAEPGIADFYMRLLDLPDGTAGRLEVRALKLNGAAIALALITKAGGYHYLLNMALVQGAPRDCSPGAILVYDDIEHAHRDGDTGYDFGPGAAAYKAAWQPETVPLTTSIAAVSPAGIPAAASLAASSRGKSAIKRSPRLWPMAQRLRRRLRGTSGAPTESD